MKARVRHVRIKSSADPDSVAMKLHHFEAVVSISERGSIRAAARHLRLAQPALTRSLAELERELGAPLFERSARGVVATAIGRAFIVRATSILHEIQKTRDEIGQLSGACCGTVTVGLSMVAHLALLAPALRRFRTRYPGSRLHIIEGLYPTLSSDLEDGTVDFYIGPGPRLDEKLLPSLCSEVLFAGRRTVLCRAGHPLASATSLRELADADWATTSITLEAERELGTTFERCGLRAPRIVIQSQSALTLLTCLVHTDTLAMAPPQWAEPIITGGALACIAVTEDLQAPDIVLVQRADLPLTPAAGHLLDLMRRAQLGMSRR